jgi:hypothetical protein
MNKRFSRLVLCGLLGLSSCGVENNNKIKNLVLPVSIEDKVTEKDEGDNLEQYSKSYLDNIVRPLLTENYKSITPDLKPLHMYTISIRDEELNGFNRKEESRVIELERLRDESFGFLNGIDSGINERLYPFYLKLSKVRSNGGEFNFGLYLGGSDTLRMQEPFGVSIRGSGLTIRKTLTSKEIEGMVETGQSVFEALTMPLDLFNK